MCRRPDLGSVMLLVRPGPGALSDAMILACANQPSAKQTDRAPPANASPLLSPKEFFTMPTSPSEHDAPALLVSSPSHDHTRAHSAPQKLVVRNASVNDRILHDDSGYREEDVGTPQKQVCVRLGVSKASQRTPSEFKKA